MSDSSRRRPPTRETPGSPRNTLSGTGRLVAPAPDATMRQPKLTPPKGSEQLGGPTAPMNAQSEQLDQDEQTRTAGPTDSLLKRAGAPKFNSPDDPHARTAILGGRTAPMLTPSPQTVRDMPSVKDLPAIVDQLAAGDPPTGEIQKAKVWVATHKPPVDPDPRLILLCEPDSQRAASFRVLRHRLAELSDPRTIAVTSAEAREGKTTCAANLAMALGECGRARVLLVEANLRNPSLAALFGFLPPECFAAQLTRHRERPLDPWSVVEVFSPSLHVAAVKPGPENENRPLLDGVAFGIAMDMLKRSGYDYIVVDTPPVLGSADVNLIEDFTDGVLLTTWSRQSSTRALCRAIDQLSPAKILGITLLDA